MSMRTARHSEYQGPIFQFLVEMLLLSFSCTLNKKGPFALDEFNSDEFSVAVAFGIALFNFSSSASIRSSIWSKTSPNTSMLRVGVLVVLDVIKVSAFEVVVLAFDVVVFVEEVDEALAFLLLVLIFVVLVFVVAGEVVDDVLVSLVVSTAAQGQVSGLGGAI